MHPESGSSKPGGGQRRLLFLAGLLLVSVAGGLSGATGESEALPGPEGGRLEGPRRVVVRDLPPAAIEATSQERDVVLPRRGLAGGAEEADVSAPPANVLDASFSVGLASAPAPSAAGFEGLDNNDNATVSGLIVTPPDPQLAVGPRHVFEMVNVVGRIYSRTGGAVQTFTLASFFGVPAGYSNTDPKVIYDAASARWFASYVSLVDNGGANNDEGRLHIAVSQTNDPTGAWNLYQVVYPKVFPDYAGIGLTSDKFTVSSNVFDIDGPPQPVTPGCFSDGYCGEQTIVFEKADLLAGASAPAVCGPSVNVGACFLPASGPPFNAGRFTVRPAHSLSLVGDQYLATVDLSTLNQLTVIRVSGTPDGGDLAEASATNLPIITQDAPPASATTGGGSIDSGDFRLLEAIWRDGHLWSSASAACIPAGDSAMRSCAHLVEVDTNTNTVLQDIMFGATGEYFSWPAIRTDGSSDVYVSLTHTSPSVFAEARASGRVASDPPNTMSGSVLLRAGDVAHTSGRWGDYLGAAVDPRWPECVWLVGEYAKNTPFSSTWDWGTFIAATSYSGGCDGDADGWSDSAETTIGTNPALACGPSANPADINDDGFWDITDLGAIAATFGQSVPPAVARHDIAPEPPDGFVDITDLGRVAALFGRACGA